MDEHVVAVLTLDETEALVVGNHFTLPTPM